MAGGYGGGEEGGEDAPVILDLAGRGIKVTPLTSSNTFVKLGDDGYAHRTAWAGAGNAVLFFDPSNSGTIAEADQVNFTLWDPTASSDMQALRDVFDTNHNGKLDAGDAGYAKFKLMVTAADGTTSVETLAQAGIASINLVPGQASVVQPDGSAITGHTVYTKTDGSTGAAADVTLATDPTGVVAKQVVTHNPDGSTTIENRAYTPAGKLASYLASNTSADGLTVTLTADPDGNGVIDTRQTDATTTDASHNQVETVSDFGRGGVSLVDRTTTTTSADGRTVTIARDLNGGGIVQQTEARVTAADASSTDTITNVNKDGSSRGKVVTSISADGLTETTQADHAGSGTFDLTTKDVTTVGNDGTRTESVKNTNQNATLLDQTLTTISADGQTKTTKVDADGSGAYELTNTSQTVTNQDGSSTTTVMDKNGDYTLRDRTVSVISADGLTKTVSADLTGDYAYDRVSKDATVVGSDGSRTETVTLNSNNGALLSKTVTVKGADGQTRSVSVDSNGDGATDAQEAITVGSNGIVTDLASVLNTDGTLAGRTATTTSADGSSTTVQQDHAGSGTYDTTTSDVTYRNGNGNSTETVTVSNHDNSPRAKTVTVTSANDLTKNISSDVTGDGTYDVITTDATTVNGDNSLLETISATSSNGTLLTQAVFKTSADRRTLTITRDSDGDGHTNQTETVGVADNGTVTDTTSDLNADGTLVDKTVTTTTGNRLSVTTLTDQAGSGTYNLQRFDVTVLNADGSRTETVSDKNADGSPRDATVTITSGNGLKVTTAHDYDGNGTTDLLTTDATALNNDGSRTEKVRDTNNNGSLRDSTVTVTSGNGLSRTVSHDFDGDGTVDLTVADGTLLNADGSTTETLTDTNVHGLRDQTVITHSGDGKTVTTQQQFFGSVNYTRTETVTQQSNGDTVDAVVLKDANGNQYPLGSNTTIISANGLNRTVQDDTNAFGVGSVLVNDQTVINNDGSRFETVTRNNQGSSTALIDKSTAVTSANGLNFGTVTDRDGDGQTDLVTSDITVLGADGSQTETLTLNNHNGSGRGKTTTVTSADRRTVTVTRAYGGAGTGPYTVDGKEVDTTTIGSNGTVTETLTHQDGSGIALASRTIATSASGLSRTSTMTSTAGATVYQGTDAVALNNDGGRTETFSSSDTRAYAPGSPGFASSVTQTTSANGLVKSTQATLTGALTSSYAAADATVLNADGSNAETITDTIGGQAADRVTLSLSANALTKVFTLDEDGNGTTDLSDTAAYATDGTKTEALTVNNFMTGAQQQHDVITTSPDGRTTTLNSARNGDTAFDHFETTIFTPDGGYYDGNWVTNPAAASTNPGAPANSMTAAPNYKQTRVQANAATGQTLTVTDYAPDGMTVQETTISKVDTIGLNKSLTIQVAGVTPAALNETDTTVLNSDGSIVETVKATGATGAIVFQRTITTTADGRSVTTMVDNDGNGIYEHGDVHVVIATGRQLDTETDYSNTSSSTTPLPVSAADGTTSPTLVEAISDDGLIKTATKGDVTATTALFPDANGSYQWTKTSASNGLLSSATHIIDANKVDTWTVTTPSVSTTIRLDLGSEQRDLGVAQGIYKAVLGRSIQDGETQRLAAYIQGGVLNQIQLTDDLLASGEYLQKYGTNTKANIIHAYVNLFGHLPSPTDVTNYLALLAAKTLGSDQILDALAQKAEDEAQGNGLLELLSDEDTITPTTLSLTSAADQAFMSTGAAYGTYVNSFQPSVSGSTASINAFLSLIYTTPPTYNTASNAMGTQVNVGSSSYELLTAINMQIMATASSYVQVVDFGSGNTLKTGKNSNILLRGGDDDLLYSGQGSSQLFAEGVNDQVTTGTGTTQVFVSGQNGIVDATQGTSDVVVNGTNAKVTNATSSTTVDVSGSGAQIAGTSAQIKLEGGVNTEISGSGHVITGAGLGTTTLDAGSSRLTSNASSNILINGSGDTVTTDSGSMVSIGANATGEALTVNDSQITLNTGSAASVTGNGDIVTQRASSTLTASGQGNFVDVTGTGALETLTNVDLLIDPGMSATVNGSSNAINLGAGATVYDNTTSDVIAVTGAGSAQLQSNGNITLTGVVNTSAVSVANGHTTINLGSGATNGTVVAGAIAGEVDGNDASGHRLWAQLYSTMSGALNETDQYRYNSSNVLTQVDRYNGSGTLVDSDLYSPTRNIEVGSYLYGTPNTVTEVVDLVNNYDWLRQANGSYTDKTRGTNVSQQPVLNNS